MPDLGSFHFLRPWWLLALVPIAIIALLLIRQQSATARWKRVIAPHLLAHLIVRPERRGRIRPSHLLIVALVLTTLAVAGPSWRREAPPFTEDTAPLVIAFELATSMTAQDVQPSRLERAAQKITDLLAFRKGAKTALIAYAGTAHTVLPLTDDPTIIESFVTSLDPSLMPVAGNDSVAALDLASRMLEEETAPGTIVFLSDGIGREAIPRFAEHAATHRDQVVVLAVATEAGGFEPGGGELRALDVGALDRLEREAGATVVYFTVDDSDVRRVLSAVETHLAVAQQDDPSTRWRDDGWWLVWPLALLAIPWFRRGWLVEWET